MADVLGRLKACTEELTEVAQMLNLLAVDVTKAKAEGRGSSDESTAVRAETTAPTQTWRTPDVATNQRGISDVAANKGWTSGVAALQH